MKVPKKVKAALIAEIGKANAAVWVEYMPQCVDSPPELWTQAEKAQFDILTDFERKAAEAVNKILG
ncbi:MULTISPECIES: hypothetical protein [Herbaspirillum]|uniref:Uncharacterized protein n=2 Tax=Herbaspirillum huttiense TaxID=863372 RepID=A0AAJ2HAA1_9BURK|nr:MULTISPECIES: hypothetical protein [Herbaspirillum]MDR9836952.1 hypothetical protein [Herbaspirillum huttiense]